MTIPAHEPYFNLVKAVEGSTMYDIKEAADNMLLTFQDINEAVLQH